MPDPGDVYMDELSTLFRGRATINPRRARLQSGRGLRPPIDVGDVVYDSEGQLTRLFNCLKSPDDQDEDSILPDNFEVLAIASSSSPDNHDVAIPITITERLTHAGPYFSKGVRRVGSRLGASVASVAGARFSFSTLRKQGAVLLTSGNVRTRVSPNRPAFEQYMIKHFDDWCSLILSRQLDVRPHELMFITAADYTSTWSNLVYTERQLQGDFSVDVPSVSTVGGQLSVSMDIHHTQSETRDWGPNPEDLEIERGPAAASSSDQPFSLNDDQVIFVRGLRGKRRAIFKGFQKLVGEGEPRNLDEDPFGREDGSEAVGLIVGNLGASSERDDFLTPALDFILKRTQAEMALVHDEDYRAFLQCSQQFPSNISADFIQLKSAENGIVYATINDSLIDVVDDVADTKAGSPSDVEAANLPSGTSHDHDEISSDTPAVVFLEGHRRSRWDTLRKILRLPIPVRETPAERVRPVEAQTVQRAGDSNDDTSTLERSERTDGRIDVKMLLLGQSESGKSTTLKQFQLAHAPAAFRAERMAWRPVIYLNLIESIKHVLDAISPDLDEPVDVPQTTQTNTFLAQPISAGVTLSDEEIAQKHARYAERLIPLLQLKERLIVMLAEDEATRLDDGVFPGSSGSSTIGGTSLPGESRIPAAPGARSFGSLSFHQSPHEVPLRTTSDWKKGLSLSRAKLLSAVPDQAKGEVVGWWEDPSDPVHVLGQCSRDMSALWADPWVRTRLAARRIRLEENSGFFLNDIDRITAKKYIPTYDDVLKARLKTVGVVEYTFTVSTSSKMPKPMVWKIFDVGGARKQRQAWASYFTDVNAIIFLAPISAFDQVLAEDPRVNRLEDSLLLWRSVVSNRLLQHLNLIIFLNKCDLLKAKLESGIRLNQYVQTYGERPNDYESVARYLRNKFGLLHSQYTSNSKRQLYMHFTAVIDTRRTSTIIANVCDIIVQQNLKDSELLV